MPPSLDDWWLEVHYGSIQRKSMRSYRNQCPYHKFEMNWRPNTSSYHAGDTSLVGLLHQYAYCGDSCNAEGYLNKALAAIYVNIKAVRFVLIEQHSRALLKPYWKQGYLRRDACKIIMRKTMDKIVESIEASKFPKTKSDHQKYLSASEWKIIELIQECYWAADRIFIKSFIVGGRRLEELQKESEKGNVGVAEVDENSTSNNIKAVHAFKFFHIDHIRDLLKPYWEQGNLSRDAYRIIMKKSIDKILEVSRHQNFPRLKATTRNASMLQTRRSLSSYRSQSPYRKFEMNGRSNASSFHDGGATQVKSCLTTCILW